MATFNTTGTDGRTVSSGSAIFRKVDVDSFLLGAGGQDSAVFMYDF